MTQRILSLAIAFLAVVGTIAAKRSVRVACIGNSITYGMTLPDPSTQSYPAQLQTLLGNGYEVGNFGKSGATLLRHGHRPYVAQQEWAQAKAFGADIAVIHLGINDTDPRNWPDYRDEFVNDYIAIIDTLRQQNPRCRIIVARITPITSRHPRFESGTRDWHKEIQQSIATVAQATEAQLIDFHSVLYAYPQLLPDAVHPNCEGATRLANTVYAAITGRYGGLRMPLTYTDNMVLQRNTPLHIHGTADAGTVVKVTLANAAAKTSTSLTATTNANGQWSVVLPAQKAAVALTLTIAAGKQTLKYNNVAVGEVWLCSGQSNMEFMLKEAATATADIPHATNTNLRLFDMKARWRTNPVEWEPSALDSINHLQYFNEARWMESTPTTAAQFSAVAYYFGRMLQDSLQVPVGLICNAVGGSPTEAWIGRECLENNMPKILADWTHNDYIQPWVRERAAQNMRRAADLALQRHPYEPCYLFEAGIEPLDRYDIKGVLWYQGESNAHNKDAHERLFKMLVNNWRHTWGNATMPFYYVQLSSLSRQSWPWFRDSQRRLLADIPGVAMAVTSDVGDSLNVHPTNKLPVGERLARIALHHNYGYDAMEWSGPVAVSAVAEGQSLRLHFSHANGLTTADGCAPCTFELAHYDGIFRPATARIDGTDIVLTADGIDQPRYVRYGWQPFTRANVVNADGLPASTFRMEIVK